jgi:hypothetical protein
MKRYLVRPTAKKQIAACVGQEIPVAKMWAHLRRAEKTGLIIRVRQDHQIDQFTAARWSLLQIAEGDELINL